MRTGARPAGHFRGLFGGTLAATILALATTGCASTSASMRARIDRASDGLDQDPAVRAAVLRVRSREAERDRASVVPSAQLRMTDLSGRNVDRGAGVNMDVRVSLEAPWSVVTEVDARQALVDQAIAELEVVSIERRAVLCLRGVAAASRREQATLSTAMAERLGRALSWSAAWEQAGTVDALEAARTRVSIARRLAEVAAPAAGAQGGSLPSLDTPAAPLAQSSAEIQRWIAAHHPEPAAHLAEARSYHAFADREQLRVMPWLDWVQVGYRTGYTGIQDTEVGFALRVPIDDRAGADADALRHRARAATEDAQAAAAELALAAADALARFASFEARAAQLRALEEEAAHGEELAERWLSERRGQPRAVADLFDEAYRARGVVLEARTEAGEAACDLLAATGTPVAQWPRR